MFTYYIMPKNTEKSDVEGDKIRLLQKTILNEISYNEEFRDCILGRNEMLWDTCKVDITAYANSLDTRYQGKINIVRCSITSTDCESCVVDSNNVYVSEVFVSGYDQKQRVTVCIGK